MPGDQLDRDDLIRGINAVIAKLRAASQPAGIRIVGGAALAFRYFDRRTTADVDALLQPEQPILKAAVEGRRERLAAGLAQQQRHNVSTVLRG